MNSNNQFGKCCNCPAFMSDSRLFTNWETSKTYNYKLGLKLNTDTNTEYKQKLISNPDYITNELYNNTNKCDKNDGFYEDTTLYHKKFKDNILNEMGKEYNIMPFYLYEYADY
jgi:hypothetical protein